MMCREIRLYLHVLQYRVYRPFIEVMQFEFAIFRSRPLPDIPIRTECATICARYSALTHDSTVPFNKEI